MARLSDIRPSGEWIKGEELLARQDVFDIVDCKRDRNGKYGDSLIFTLRFQDTEENSERETRLFTMPYHEARQYYLEHFITPTAEPLTSNILTMATTKSGQQAYSFEEVKEIEPGVYDPEDLARYQG